MRDKKYLFGYEYDNSTFGVLSQNDEAQELTVQKVGTTMTKTVTHDWLAGKLETREVDLIYNVKSGDE